jgi:recombination associated protein RdgC
MWFRNLVFHRLIAGADMPADVLDSFLASHACQPCGALERETRGWVPPWNDDRLVRVVQGRALIAMGVERRLLPAAVVRREADVRARALAAQRGYPVGRKELRELRALVEDELLPRAFTQRRAVRAYIDAERGWLAIDTASVNVAEAMLELLGETFDGLTVEPPRTRLAPISAMTDWLAAGEAPGGFTLDRDLELRAADAEGATVRYVRHHLEGAEIREHIGAGKRATRLGMTWRDRVSFVLDDRLCLRRLDFLDVLREQAGTAEDEEERLQQDFALMAGELAQMLDDLVEALGGAEQGASG